MKRLILSQETVVKLTDPVTFVFSNIATCVGNSCCGLSCDGGPACDTVGVPQTGIN